MEWLPDSREGVAVLVGTVAFFGALLGALVGFISTYVSTSRQIEHQERVERRQVYGDYLGRAIQLARSSSSPASALADLEVAFLLEMRRLEIVAPPEVHRAATSVHNTLILMNVEQDPGDRHARSEWFGEALECFSILARADTKAPESERWKVATVSVSARLTRVNASTRGEIAGQEPDN